jgi:ABC-type transport system involved in cytochrome c biogenesis permease component
MNDSVNQAFSHPTPKQKAAFANVLHALCAACLIGAVTLPFTTPVFTLSVALTVMCLILGAYILLSLGAVLSKDV